MKTTIIVYASEKEEQKISWSTILKCLPLKEIKNIKIPHAQNIFFLEAWEHTKQGIDR